MGVGLVLAARAQPAVLQASSPTTTSLYAQERIELLPGFSTTTDGFEAKITPLASAAGSWSKPLPWTPFVRNPSGAGSTVGMIGIHTHVLPNGKVLTWEGHNDDQNSGHLAHAYTWNPDPSARFSYLTYPNVYEHFDNDYSNLFCSGHAFLADGRLLVAGGHYSGGTIVRGDGNNPYDTTLPINISDNADYIPGRGNVNGYIGLRDANIFNYAGSSAAGGNYVWQSSQATNVAFPLVAMMYRRWYPTATTLNNGNVAVLAGQRYGGALGTNDQMQAEVPEVYEATAGTWRQLTGAARRLPLYPWVFLAPDGRLFNAGPNVRTGFLNTAGAGTWTDGPVAPDGGNAPAGNYAFYNRYYGTAVMYEPGKIMILGGGVPEAQLLDLNTANPQWQRAAPLAYPLRIHANSTLLADGTVLVSGGTTLDASNGGVDANAVLPTELWTPPTAANPGGTWATMSALDVPRLYHSTAVLLPDGTVLSAGGGQGGGFQDHPDYQVFSPPYLFKGPRPQLTQAPAQIGYRQAFSVQTPDAGRIAAVNMIRLSSTTHSFNMNQRLNRLPFTVIPGGLTLTPPSDPNGCPPGHYMLFLLDTNGVPALARIISIGPGSASNCSALTLSLSVQYEEQVVGACDIMAEITANCSGPVKDYRWSVDGVYAPGFDGQTTIALRVGVNQPTREVSVAATPSCDGGAASVTTRTFTTYFPNCQTQAQ